MTASLFQNTTELALLRAYVAEVCCIQLGPEKNYLFESRLGPLVRELGCASLADFVRRARADMTGRLRDRIVDLMTTHETLWFRDERPWRAMREELLPVLAAELREGRRARVRILCAACSTGQEPYSLAMLIDRMHGEGRFGQGVGPDRFEIVGTDVSAGTLEVAVRGRYNALEMGRGLGDDWRLKYFRAEGAEWVLREEIRRRVVFKRHNLQDSLAPLGVFQLVLCRNVAIYFDSAFKHGLFDRIASALTPGGHLLLGASESLLTHGKVFEPVMVGGVLFYRRRM